MPLRFWHALRTLSRHSLFHTDPNSRRRLRRSGVLQVEVLEDRLVPAATQLLPDLTGLADASNSYIYGWNLDTTTEPGHTLLRLSTAEANFGDGPFEVHAGGVDSGGLQYAYQRIYNSDGSWSDVLIGHFEFHASHNHFHVQDIAEYNLRAENADGSVGPMIVDGHKTSFCLIDIDHFSGRTYTDGQGHTFTYPVIANSPANGFYESCSNVMQGISAGWADVYGGGLADQWIDVTGVPAGNYYLEDVLDPFHHIVMANQVNHSVDVLINLTGVAVGPSIVDSSLGGSICGPASSATVTFSKSIDPTTFTAGQINFTGPGGANLSSAITGISAVAGSNNTQFVITFNQQTAVGSYNMAIGPTIKDTAGNLMDESQDGVGGQAPDVYNMGFTIGNPTVVAVSDLSNEDPLSTTAKVPGPLSSLRFTFNGPINPASFTSVASFTGPGGSLTGDIASVTPVAGSGNTEFDVNFNTPITLPGDYSLVLPSTVADSLGRTMGSTFSNAFNIAAPDVIFSSPANSALGPISSVRFTFSKKMDPTSFTTADILSFTGPGGADLRGSITGITAVPGSDDTQFDVTFASQGAAGIYTMTVGQNILDVGGNHLNAASYTNTFSITAPRVFSSTPSGSVAGDVSSLLITYSEPMLVSSLTSSTIASFTGPNGAITGFTITPVSSGSYSQQFTISFATQTRAGGYSLVIKPTVVDQYGNAVDQNGDGIPGQIPGDDYTASFTILAPQIIASTPQGTTLGPVDHIRVTFNEFIDPTTFTTAEASLTGPNGAITVTGVSPVGTGNTQFDVTFAPQSGTGIYTLTVGPNIRDPFGHPMAAAYTTSFSINLFGPDGFGYIGSAVPYQSMELAGQPGTFTIISAADDVSVPVDLGSNTFNFYGKVYTGNNQLFVSSNGLITFGSANSEYSNTDLTGGDPAQPAIAVLWTDWTSGPGTPMVIGKFDIANNRLIIEWNQVVHVGGNNNPVTFQAILQLNTGINTSDITFNYVNLNTGDANANGATATVGIKDADTQGSNRVLVSFNTASTFLQNQTAIQFTAPSIGGTISGTVYNDLNSDGVREAGENGLAGWTVYLDTNNNRRLDPGEPSTTTDANGNYTFTNLVPGTYTVADLMILPPSYLRTGPVGAGPYPFSIGVNLGARQTITGNDFGVHNVGLKIFNVGPAVIASSLAGTVSSSSVSSITLTFNDIMDSSFSIANDVDSFTGPGGVDLKSQITSFSWPDTTHLVINFTPQTMGGTYRLVIGPNLKRSKDGAPMDQNNNGQPGETPGDEFTASWAIALPVPTISSLSQTSTPEASGVTTITVNGSNFDWNAVVRWDGVNLVTTFISPTQLTAPIPAADLVEEGAHSITVQNPPPPESAQTSAAVAFTVTEAALSGTITATPIEGGWSGQVATFTDADPTDTTSDYAATINWGDGTSSAGTIVGSAGHFTVSGNHTYTEEGSFTISVTIAHPPVPGITNGGFEADNFSGWTFSAPAHTEALNPVVSNAKAHSGTFSAFLGGANSSGGEPNGDSFITQTVTIPFGGTPTLSFWYFGATTDTITYDWQEAQVLDTSGNMLAQIFKVCETDTAWQHVTFDLTPFEGRTIVLYFNVHGDGYGDLTAMYLDDVTISNPLAGGLSLSQKVNVADADVLTGTGTTITATEGQVFTGTVATFTDSYTLTPSSNLSALINWGDGKSSTGTVTGSAGHFTVTGSHTYGDEGTFAVSVTLKENAPGTATAKAASTAAIAEGDALTGKGTSFSLTLATLFNGSVATFTDSLTSTPAGDFRATINWGDGTTGGSVSGSAGSFSVSGSHRYLRAGTFSVTVTLTDDGTGTATATATTTITVIQPNYTVTDLGTLGGTYSYARALNNAGQVVGYSYTTGNSGMHAFLYSGGPITDLGTLGGTYSYATGINDAGQVVGYSSTSAGTYHAFLYSSGVMTDIGTLGGTYSYATGINASGQVVGYSYTTGDSALHAFFYTGGQMTDLGTLGGTYSYAMGVNASGQVTGYSYTTGNSGMHAFLYSAGHMTDLGTLGGTYSVGEGINNAGQVVGYASTAGNNGYHAFVYSGGHMTDLGTLGGTYSFAYDINNLGQVVGYAYTAGNAASHPFLYSGGVLTDLTAFLPTTGPTVASINGINDAGQISGYGNNGSGQYHALLLTPNTANLGHAAALVGSAGAVAAAAYLPLASSSEVASPSVNQASAVTWTGSSSDVRALQNASSGSTGFTTSVHFASNQAQAPTLYAVERYDSGRMLAVDILDPLAHRPLSRMKPPSANGPDAVWNLTSEAQNPEAAIGR